jgi:hypothetical protein
MRDVFKRSPKATRRHLINLFIVACAAGYFWWDLAQTELTYSKVMAIVFSVWAVFILVAFLRRFTVAEVTDQTIIVHGLLRKASVPVALLKHYKLRNEKRMGMFVWDEGGKERISVISLRQLDAEQVEKLAASVARLRPELPNLTSEQLEEIYSLKSKTKA